jgi:MscS family membrane protein
MHAWLAQPWWNWVALTILPVAALLGGYALSKVVRLSLAPVVARTSADWDDRWLASLGGPLTLALATLVAYLGLPWLVNDQSLRDTAIRVMRAALLFTFFWALVRSVDTVVQVVLRSTWFATHPAARALLPLAARVGKVAIGALAIVAFLSYLGYPVASLLAGLGIGGLAVALASKSTLENLLGAFAIGADQPFREGDSVKIEDFVGTVETIGLRSTRIRTLDRTLINLPNAKLAEMRTECYAPRDRIRLACTLTLVHGTSAAQVRQVLAEMEKVLTSHPRVWPEGTTVRLLALAANGVEIEVAAWFTTTDWSKFQAIRQDILLTFMDIVERAGTSFATTGSAAPAAAKRAS